MSTSRAVGLLGAPPRPRGRSPGAAAPLPRGGCEKAPPTRAAASCGGRDRHVGVQTARNDYLQRGETDLNFVLLGNRKSRVWEALIRKL
jgi:hypothetical protein